MGSAYEASLRESVPHFWGGHAVWPLASPATSCRVRPYAPPILLKEQTLSYLRLRTAPDGLCSTLADLPYWKYLGEEVAK